MSELSPVEKRLLSHFVLLCGHISKYIPSKQEEDMFVDVLYRVCCVLELEVKDLENADAEATYMKSLRDLLK